MEESPSGDARIELIFSYEPILLKSFGRSVISLALPGGRRTTMLKNRLASVDTRWADAWAESGRTLLLWTAVLSWRTKLSVANRHHSAGPLARTDRLSEVLGYVCVDLKHYPSRIALPVV
jgi:hypothetical protein